MTVVLMVAEKPSLAKSLADILSSHRAVSHKGNGGCTVHEYNGTFQGQPVHFRFTSVMGHVMTTDFPAAFNNWDAVKPIELFTAPVEKKESNPKSHMNRFLRDAGKGASYLVLWLDCDREGENICFEVMDAVVPVMNKSVRGKTVFRAKFSAITAKDVKHAMETLGEPNKNESLAVDARQELDLRIGCAFTRFQTRFFQGLYGDLDSSLISFGPCQTPTLGLCVERHDKIQHFQPETFWTLDVRLGRPQGGSDFKAEWGRVRVFDRTVGSLFLDVVSKAKGARVVSVVQKEKSKSRPGALNTVELMRIASSGLGMGPQYAMTIAERLYMQGYISYPRTETTAYPENFDLRGTLSELRGSRQFGQLVAPLLSGGMVSPKGGKDVGDHPPITPSRAASEGELTGDMWRIYDLVVRIFIASLSPDCKYLQTTATFDLGGEEFTCVGQKVISKGFTSVLHWIGPDEGAQSIPDLTKGDICTVASCKLAERRTSPPSYLTESDLISLMEKHGIGTDASIPVHINNICERNYVKVESDRRLVPTELGVVLVHGYYKIDQDLVLPTMRSALERQLDLIAAGKADFEEVLLHAVDIFQRKFAYFEQHVQEMDELFSVSFTPLSETGKALTRCGQCMRYMKLVQAKPVRLHCQTCNETYSMPQNGKVVEYKGLRCPLDNFEMVMWTTGARGQAYPLCPYCFNNPPFEGMAKHSGCNACTHPTCQHSLVANGVCPCVECGVGTLVLDPSSAPKWRMACNRCNVVIRLFENAHRVRTAKDESCEECGAKIMKVDFNKQKTPLENGETKHEGCVFCDEVLSGLVQLRHAVHTHPSLRRGRGRGGRGRGRGRRRGRGAKTAKGKMAYLDSYFV
eukprot:m.313864 g.313864  ORF g.313864 m.313864 type:complete len:860 (+) comp19665_c0_seq2:161-2740(+)